MGTVTFVPTAGSYRLGMNRDERHARAAGLPPAVRELEGRVAVFPSEPGGGTWIAVNERRAAFALVNWYPLEAMAPAAPVSRGTRCAARA